MSGSQQTMVLQVWQKKKEKIEHDFPVYDYTQDQNGSPYFFSMFQQRKWPSLLREILKINKFCYHGNLSRTSLLYTGMQLVEYLSPKMSCNDWM